jgi:hypothetical protein
MAPSSYIDFQSLASQAAEAAHITIATQKESDPGVRMAMALKTIRVT